MIKTSLVRRLLRAAAIWCCLTLLFLGLDWLSSWADVGVFSAIFLVVVTADLLVTALSDALRRRFSPPPPEDSGDGDGGPPL